MRVLVTTRQRWEQLREDAEGCRKRSRTCCSSTPTGDGSDEDDGARCTPWSDLVAGDVRRPAAASRAIDARHRRDPLHVRQHRHARRASCCQPPQPAGGRRERQRPTSATPRDDVILAALPLSFDAGLSQVTTAFAVGAHVVLVNYLLPRDVVRLCARHGVTGLTCVPPLWIQLADADWPAEAAASLRYFANTGGRMPRATLDRLREIFPQASPFLMYGLTEAFRSTYLDPSEVDRRPDSIGKAIPDAEILVLRPDGTPCGPGEEGELVHRGALVALRATGTTPSAPPSGSARIPGGADWRAPELAVWSGDTRRRRRGGLPLLRRPHRRHDQDLRLPGEPDRDRGGRLRHRPGPRRGRARRRRTRPSGTGSWSSSAPRSRRSTPTRCSRRSAGSCRCYMVPGGDRRARRAAPLAQREVRPRCCCARS